MLNTTETSAALKTAGLAVTYRAGAGNCYGTCPTSCALNPSDTGSNRIDREYLDALLAAVPRRGLSFTYSHFHWRYWFAKMRTRIESGKPTTTINYSADNLGAAKRAMAKGVPTVIAIPESDAAKHERRQGVRLVQCPATYRKDFGCQDCGGGIPLCARPERDYAITFPAHGASKRKVGTNTKGGCYASGGNVVLHWRRLAEMTRKAQAMTDGEKLRQFAKSLKPGKILRHHVAGDLGKH